MTNSLPKSLESQEKVHLIHFLLKSLLWNQHVSKSFQQICFIFSHLQCTALLLWILLNNLIIKANETLFVAVRSIAGNIAIQKLFTFGLDQTTTTFAVMVIILCYLLAIGLMLGFIVWSYLKAPHEINRKNNLVIYMCQFHINIGFWVINMVCMDYLGEGLFNTGSLNLDSIQMGTSALYIIFIVFNYLFGLLFARYSYDPFMTSNLLSCHSSGTQLFLFLFKAFLAPMTSIMQSSDSQNWLLVTFPITILGLSHHYLMTTFPYYQYSVMKICISFSAIHLLICLTNFIVLVINNVGGSTSGIVIYLLALLIPLMVKIGLVRLDMIISKYLAIQNNEMKTKEDVIKKLFSLTSLTSKAILTINNELNKSPHELKLWGILSIMSHHHERTEHKTDEEQLGSLNDGRYTASELCSHYTNLGKTIIKHVLQYAVHNFPGHGHFKVLFARFAMENNLPFLATSLCISDTMKYEGLAKITAMSLKQTLQDNITGFFDESRGKVLHLKNFLDVEEATNKLTSAIQSISHKYILFWAKYSEPQLNMKEFYQKSKEIELEADNITKIWQNSASRDKVFAHNFCTIYSVYLSQIRSSPYEAHKVVQRYYLYHLEEAYNVANESPLNEDNLINPYVIAFYSSMTPEHAGKVLNHSLNLTKLLGWTKEDLVGRHIEKVLPAFMEESHQKMLNKHINGALEGNIGSKMYKIRDSYILHQKGHLVPCEVYISIHPYVHDLPRYMVLVRIKKVKGDCLLVSRKGTVEGYTSKIGTTLGLNLEQRVQLTSLCQHSLDLEEVLHAPVLQAGLEKSTARLEKIINKKNEIMERRRGSKRIFEQKTIFEALYAMKRTFSLNFYVPKGDHKDKGQGINPYSVHLSPKFFGDLFYFMLEVEQESLDENTLQYLSNAKSFHQKSLREETGFTMEDIPTNENEHATLPEFRNQTANQMTVVSDKPLIRTQLKPQHFYFQPEKYTSLDRISAQGNSKLDVSVKSPAFKMDVLYSEQEPDNQYPDEIVSPVHSGKPLAQVLSESWGDQKSSSKPGGIMKGVKTHVAASSVGTSRNMQGKIEKAIKVVPKNRKIRTLYNAMVSFMMVFCAPLFGFYFYNANLLGLVESSISAISTAIFRLVRITDVAQYTRNIWQAKIGLYESDRYAQYGYVGDAFDILLDQTGDILIDLNNKNNQLRSYIRQLDSALQDELYADRVPIYEVDVNGNIVSDRIGNTFDVITEVVSEGIQFLSLDWPIDSTNPHMLFILNNTFNDVLTASERTIPILTLDNQKKLTSQEKYLYITMSFLGVIGILILVFFLDILKEFTKDRRHFINIFPMLNEVTIEKQLLQVQTFLNTLEDIDEESKTKIDIRALVKFNRAKIRDLRQNKKSVSTKGIEVLLVLLYSGGIFFVLMLFSVYIGLLIYVSFSNSNILTKMNLMEQSDLNLFYTNFLLTSIYEYVQESASTNIMMEPIKTKWESIYTQMSQSQSFLLTDLLQSGNGLSDDPQLQQVITGNLCAIIDVDDENVDRMCPTMGAGAAQRGIIGLDGYLLASVKTAKDYYDSSAKTLTDKATALDFQGLIDVETFYPFTLSSSQWVDRLIREGISRDFDNYQSGVLAIVVIYLVAYIVLGGVLCRKITTTLEKEINDWRKMLRQIPHSIMVENKLLKGYLTKISDGMLNLG